MLFVESMLNGSTFMCCNSNNYYSLVKTKVRHAIPCQLWIHLFIHLFIYSFIHLFIYSFIHLFIYSFIHLFIYSFIHLFICSFVYLFICSFIHLTRLHCYKSYNNNTRYISHVYVLKYLFIHVFVFSPQSDRCIAYFTYVYVCAFPILAIV